MAENKNIFIGIGVIVLVACAFFIGYALSSPQLATQTESAPWPPCNEDNSNTPCASATSDNSDSSNGATASTSGEQSRDQENTPSGIQAFENAYSKYLDASGQFAAQVFAANLSTLNTTLERYTNDFVQMTQANSDSARLAFATDGLPLAKYNVSSVENTALETAASQSVLSLNTAAAAIKNITLRNQAISVATLASRDLQRIRAYKSAFLDKHNLIITLFQDVINENGGMSSLMFDMQRTQSQMEADNNILGSFNSSSDFGVETANAHAQFQGLVKAQ